MDYGMLNKSEADQEQSTLTNTFVGTKVGGHPHTTYCADSSLSPRSTFDELVLQIVATQN